MPATFKFKTGPFRPLEAVRRVVRKPTLIGSIADFIRNRIFQFTKRGYSLGALKTTNVSSDNRRAGDARKLRPLSSNYIEFRKALNKQKRKMSKKTKQNQKPTTIRTGSFFSPTRSNLTLTGQMLDALDTKTDASKGLITVFVESSKRDGESLTNAEVAAKVANEGRPFLGLDRTGRDRVTRMVIAELRRQLKRK